MTDTGENALYFVMVLVVGLLVLWMGINAYRGVYRGWMVRPYIFQGYLGPGALFLGIGVIVMSLMPLAALFVRDGATTLSGAVAVVSFFGGLLLVVTGYLFAQVGMPARWRPGWVREIEGLPARPGDPAPVASEVAPEWSSVRTRGPGNPAVAAGGRGGYAPPLGAVSARSMAAVEWSLVGKARTRQKDEVELGRLRSWGLLDEKNHPSRAASLLMSRKARKDASTYRLEAEPPGTRYVVATPVDDVTVLEFRQDWDGRMLDLDRATGSWDVVALTEPDQVADLVHAWIVSAP